MNDSAESIGEDSSIIGYPNFKNRGTEISQSEIDPFKKFDEVPMYQKETMKQKRNTTHLSKTYKQIEDEVGSQISFAKSNTGMTNYTCNASEMLTNMREKNFEREE